jgi:hypothetical protein
MAEAFRFFLGTHEPAWLRLVDVPLFISRRRLGRVKRKPLVARTAWALDSGGFTELTMFGAWTVSPRQYVDEVRAAAERIGQMQWAAPQDWMCEPFVTAKTGLTVVEHQRRTVENFLELRSIAPDLPIIPVLQGWSAADYLRCIGLYVAAGVDLAAEPTVGLGTVCRRQGTSDAVDIVSAVVGAVPGIRLHGFGFKSEGIALASSMMASADSLAWSLNARKHPPLPGHTHASCANCLEWALRWRESVLSSTRNRAFQRPLFVQAAV